MQGANITTRIRDIEKKWTRVWETKPKYFLEPSPLQLLHHKPTNTNDITKYYSLAMFPYPSGKLHMGHVRVYTINDVIARYHKMNGKRVFQPFGWDSFGLPAENAARINNTSPSLWTLQNINDMKNQLLPLGLSIDWSSELLTSDKSYYKWTQWLFLRLFNAKLAYQKESYVNWDPVDKTVLANEQVLQGGVSWRSGAKVEQKLMNQWYFKTTHYAHSLLSDLEKLKGNWPNQVLTMQKNWIGEPSKGSSVKFSIYKENSNRNDKEKQEFEMEVFTTRPDTLFGVTFLAIAPQNPSLSSFFDLSSTSCVSDQKNKLQKLINDIAIQNRDNNTDSLINANNFRDGFKIEGYYTKIPLSNGEERKIPIYVASYVLPNYGTGVVMGVPGHDSRDFEFASLHNIPIISVIDLPNDLENNDKSIEIANNNNKEEEIVKGKLINSGKYNGLEVDFAASSIVQHLKEIGKGDWKFSYRLKDWLISRQRYWGAPIPIIHCSDCGVVGVPEDQLPVELPIDLPNHRSVSSLADIPDWSNTSCPKCGKEAKRETDTMDTFVDSSWYYLRYVDNNNNNEIFNKEKVNEMLPVDIYVGGVEHAILHLLYSRFITKFLCHHEKLLNFDEPFTHLLTQGMVQGRTFRLAGTGRYLHPDEVSVSSDGKFIVTKTPEAEIKITFEKMSKSKYNGIDPQEVIDTYGADVTRLFTLFKAPPDKVLEWDSNSIQGQYRWILRLLKLIDDFLQTNPQSISILPADKPLHNNDKTLIEFERKIHQTIINVSKAIEVEKSFNTAISHLMILSNDLSDLAKNYSSTQLYCRALRCLVILLSPLAPYVAAELWEQLITHSPYDECEYAGSSSSTFVTDQHWPISSSSVLNSTSENEIEVKDYTVQINGKFRGVFSIPRSVINHYLANNKADNEENRIIKTLEQTSVKKFLPTSQPVKLIFVEKHSLINIIFDQQNKKKQ